MFRSNTSSSRSTVYSSKQSSSSRRKKKFAIKSIERLPLSEIEILAKKTIKDIIEHAIQIADFHIRHKKYQKTYENRKIKREQNFITQDEQFSGCLPKSNEKYDWSFLSKILGKIIYLESNGDLKIYDFKTDMYLLFNLSEKNPNKTIIASELYEYEQNVTCHLFILYKDFTFYTIDLFLLDKEGSLLSDPEDISNLINNSKKTFFNCKPYLNIPNIDEYFPNYENNLKIIIFPKMLENCCTDIILNFTQIAGKFLIYNTFSNSVVGNYIINQKDYVTTESDYLMNLRKLICAFFEKIWSVKQYELLCEIIDTICNKKNNDNKKVNVLEELKKLSILLNMASNDEDDNLSLILKTQQYTFTNIRRLKSAKERNVNAENLYSSVILPIFAKSSMGHCMISLETLLIELKTFFDKLYGCSIAVGKSDLSLIQGRYKLYQKLFLKCYNREINLKQLFINKDPENFGYVDEKVAYEILQNLPIGLTSSEIEELLSSYNILDENGKYMYDYLFLLDEQIITGIVFSSPLNLLGDSKFTCGYFIKNSTVNDIVFNERQLDNIKAKMSAPTEKDGEVLSLDSQFNVNKVYGNNIEERGNLFMPENTINYEGLIDYIINSCFTIEINDIIYLTSLNVIFIITPYNQNIPIFRCNTKLSNKTQTLELIGKINLNSYYSLSPLFLFCIEERNLLITQRYTCNSTEIIFIDISKDLLFPSRDQKSIEYNVTDDDTNCKKIKNLLTFEKGRENVKFVKKFDFLKKNELFAIISDDCIYIINPKSHTNDISLKMQEIEKTVYTKLCRKFCENPIEQTGEPKFKLLYKIKLISPLKKFSLFSLGNDLDEEQLHHYSNTDWLFLLFDTGEISSYCVNQVYLSQKAKEIDTPLPEKDVEQLFLFSINNMKNSLAKYQNYLIKSSSDYNNINKKKEEIVDQITLNIKQAMLFEQIVQFDQNNFQIHTIHQLIYLLKMMGLKFETYQLFEMFPYIQFSELQYEFDADYFKTELFPNDKNYEEIGMNIEDISLPKNKNKLKSDLSSLESNLSMIDSAIKKLAKYIVDRNIKNDQIFKDIDTNNEEILEYCQFYEGCEKYGLLNKKYLKKDELRLLFENMDENHTNVLTLDEYNRYLEKIDIFSAISAVKNEKEKRIKEEEFLYDIEKFVTSSEEEKKQALNPILEKVQNFYSNMPEIKYDDIKNNMKLISEKISQNEVKTIYSYGFIFLDEFKNLIYKNIPQIKEEDMNKIFAFFDQNNKNLFIYVRDFVNYLEKKEIQNDMLMSTEFHPKMTGEQFLLILIGIIKKLLKLSIIELGISPDDFSEKFILSKKYEKHIIILNYVQTEKAKENIKRKITNFLPIEEKILFNNYIDFYNYGILYVDELKSLFDSMMNFINKSNIYDLTKFDTFDLDNANKYINKQKYNKNMNEKILENNYLMKLLPVYDKTLLEFAYHTQKKDNMQNLKLLYDYLKTIGEEKEFLSQKEFMKFLKEIIPPILFNYKFAKNLINQLCENVTLINEPIRQVLTVSRIILFIINIIKKVEVMKPIINIQELAFGNDTILLDNFNKSICRLSQFDSLINEINNLSENYLRIIKDCSFSGLIIINKNEILDNIKIRLSQTNLDIADYYNYYMNLGNDKLISNFNNLLEQGAEKEIEIKSFNYDMSLPENFLSLIDIPLIKVDVLDTKEMINLKRYQSGMIENFDYFQPELQCMVNVTKMRKSFLKKQISKDHDNLYNHIIQSLKLNHYLQKIFLENSNTKSFDNFIFLRNFGIYTKEILIDKDIEEEFYIINEKIDLKEYISFQTLAKINGGLLYIPEIANTSMGFFILRAWGKNVLTIINELNQINRCFKYFNIKDFYGTYNGRKIKMANIYSSCCYNERGEMTFGPDFFKILLLLDMLPTGMADQLSFDALENIYSNDAYIAPEIITKINGDEPNYKIDSWLYGTLLFNLMFGVTPKSFYSQFKEWSDTFIEENSAKQLLNDESFDILSSNFFYNPFNNIKEISQDKNYFSKILKNKSFSAIIKLGHHDSNKYNIWAFIDLINACLNIDPKKRPSINSLINFDLFKIDPQLYVTYQKDVANVIDYYSPDNVIKDKMLIPLRGICYEVIRNKDTKKFDLNNYQNYIYNVIQELNKYLFNKTFDNSMDDNSRENDSISSTNESYEDFKDQFMDNTSEYSYKKTVLVKYVIENKVVDILIFLVLRHFNNNLKVFKQKMQNESNNIEEEKNSNINVSQSTFVNSKMLQKMKKDANGSHSERNKIKKYYSELNDQCGKLITALVKFLYQCVEALNTYEHILSFYVENVLIWIIKLFIGEENQLLGNISDDRDSNDKMKKYLLYRTFMRDENIVMQKDFQEDELDRIFSITNANKQLIEIKSHWTPELHYFVNLLFREAFGENCSGSFKHRVIKNYFLTSNSLQKSENKINPLSKNDEILNFISSSEENRKIIMKYNFINTDYVSEIFSLIDIMNNLSDKNKNLKQLNEMKKNALNYLNIIFKSKNSSKIRGCLDCKIHFLIQEYLFTSINDIKIKKELFKILKEISLSLVDVNEISWLFGNNYEKIYGVKSKKLSQNNDLLDLEKNPYFNESSWDSKMSLIDFMNDILTQPHSFVLNFTNKILNTQSDSTTYTAHMKEFGYIFSSPLTLKPVMNSLKKRNEKYNIRQICLEILFNVLLSNKIKITSNLNMTICNFYEILMDIINMNYMKSSSKLIGSYPIKKEDDFEVGEKEKYFLESVNAVIKIIIEMQNPDIKRQIFNCPQLLKYMEKNKLSFTPKLELYEIEEQFVAIQNLLNFENLEGKIIFLIDAFKRYIYETNEKKLEENMPQIGTIITVIHHIFNNEWSNGLKSSKKNCLVFNIVKLFEWLIKSNHREYLFPKNRESFTSSIIISFMSKMKENAENMKKLILEINKMSVVPISEKNKSELRMNLFGNNMYIWNKIYNFISIQLLNIIYHIFSLGDNYYNTILNKLKIGILLSELFICQLETLSLFLEQENVDISVLNNYMTEVKIRLGLIETISKLPKIFDDIKMQFLQSEFINYIFKYMIDDNRKFKTNSKKLSLDFLPYKSSYPMRNEAIVILDIIFKKYYNKKMKTETDSFIFDEVIRNVKVFHLVQNQLAIIKTKIKGDEVLSVLGFFNMVLSNNEREIIKIMNSENAKDYFIYALQKETSIKKIFPFIVEYIDKVQAGIEK